MIFTTRKLIRFQHCDPAGIVFYPQFYVLMHEAHEDLLAHIGQPEHLMIAAGFGLPMVSMQTEFVGMCRFGDEVDIDVSITKLGGASVGMRYLIRSEAVARVRATSTVVYVNNRTSKAEALPATLRTALEPYLESST
jgi:4-hydroxybenzoyl-CoA thioesterase